MFPAYDVPHSHFHCRHGAGEVGTPTTERANLVKTIKKQGKESTDLHFHTLDGSPDLVSNRNILFVRINYLYLFFVNLLVFSKLARVADLLVKMLKVHDRNLKKLVLCVVMLLYYFTISSQVVTFS